MTTGRAIGPHWPLATLTVFGLASGAVTPARAEPTRPEPIAVAHEVSVRPGDWSPLDPSTVRQAIERPALDHLARTGWIRAIALDGDPGEEASGHVGLALALDRLPTDDVATLAIALDAPIAPGGPARKRAAQAAIALRDLDAAGIEAALEHLGRRAADRLAAKLDCALAAATPGDPLAPVDSDAAGRTRLAEARAAKRAGRLAEAQRAFESVATSEGLADPSLRRLADDEIRYGLPLYEALQALNELGRAELRAPSRARTAALARAEHLLRQILAENATHTARVVEARRALDDLTDATDGLGDSPRTSLLMRMQALRIAMVDFAHSAGRCPEVEWIQDTARRMRSRVLLDEITFERDHAMRYVFRSAASRMRVALRCSDDGIEIVESGDGVTDFPAALSGSSPAGVPTAAPDEDTSVRD